MVLVIPSLGFLVLLILLFLVFSGNAPASTRGLLVTLINLILIALIIFFVLSFFGVIQVTSVP